LTEEETFQLLGKGSWCWDYSEAFMGKYDVTFDRYFWFWWRKKWRKREEEFGSSIQTKEELIQKWNEGWNPFLSH